MVADAKEKSGVDVSDQSKSSRVAVERKCIELLFLFALDCSYDFISLHSGAAYHRRTYTHIALIVPLCQCVSMSLVTVLKQRSFRARARSLHFVHCHHFAYCPSYWSLLLHCHIHFRISQFTIWLMVLCSFEFSMIARFVFVGIDREASESVVARKRNFSLLTIHGNSFYIHHKWRRILNVPINLHLRNDYNNFIDN